MSTALLYVVSREQFTCVVISVCSYHFWFSANKVRNQLSGLVVCDPDSGTLQAGEPAANMKLGIINYAQLHLCHNICIYLIDPSTVSDAILVGGQTRQNLQ